MGVADTGGREWVMSSRTAYKMPRGRSRKRWTGFGRRLIARIPEGQYRRYPVPEIFPHDVRELVESKRRALRALRINKRRDRMNEPK